MKRIVMLISILFCVLGAGAQSNIISEIESYAHGEGKVRISNIFQFCLTSYPQSSLYETE